MCVRNPPLRQVSGEDQEGKLECLIEHGYM
jgi:hypothetical protein